MFSIKKAIKHILPVTILSKLYVEKFFKGTLDLKIYNGQSYAEALSSDLKIYLSDAERNDASTLRRIVADAIRSNLLCGFKPHEYFMYDLRNKVTKDWYEYLSEMDRVVTLTKGFGSELKMQLRDKWKFYELAKPFFKREIFHLSSETKREDFYDFSLRIQHIFCKPTDGHMGIGIYKYDVTDSNKEEIYFKLMSYCSDWVIEECIIQGEEMACWNESSINTIRFPSFYRDGVLTPFYPRIRVGRKGQIVDNAAQGGLLAFVNPKTGVINTDGYMKNFETCKNHPDSNIVFVGTQIPHWNELLEYATQLHKALPQHIYIAWDFAYTTKGWDVVEANWGQMDSTQMIIGHGVKREFHQLLGI